MLPEVPRSQKHQRHRDQRVKRQARIQPDQHSTDAHQLQNLQQKSARELMNQAVKDFAVVGYATHQRTDLMPVVIGNRQLLQLLNHLAAQAMSQTGADVSGQPSLEYADD